MEDIKKMKSFYRDILKMIYPDQPEQVLEKEVEKLAKSRAGANFKSACEKIEDKANSLVQKADGHISKQQAVNEVLQKNPELYNEYIQEDNAVKKEDVNNNVNDYVNVNDNSLIWGDIEKLARKKRRKNPGLTREQAIKEVLESKRGIELYNQYLNS